MEAALKKLRGEADISAQSIMARTASERLAAEIARINLAAMNDENAAKMRQAEIYKATTLAVAEASRAMDDFKRRMTDEISLSGGLSAAERVRRQTAIDFRDIRERTDLPTLRPADSEWRSQIKYSERARDLWTGWAGGLPEGFGAGISRFKLPDMNSIPLNASSPFPGGKTDLVGTAAAGASGRLASAFGGELDKLRQQVENARLGELWKPILNDAERAIEGNNRALNVQIETFGRSTFEVARATEAIRLENDIRRQGLEITDAMGKRIANLAEAQAAYSVKAEKQQETQRSLIESMDLVRSTTGDLIGSPLKAMMRGESAAEALKQTRLRLGDKLIDMGTSSITKGLFDSNGKAGGGLLGGLLGDLMGRSSTAMMNVSAGIVNVGGVGAIAGGIPAQVGDAGVLVPTDDPAALGEAIIELLRDPDRRIRWRRPVREHREILHAFGER